MTPLWIAEGLVPVRGLPVASRRSSNMRSIGLDRGPVHRRPSWRAPPDGAGCAGAPRVVSVWPRCGRGTSGSPPEARPEGAAVASGNEFSDDLLMAMKRVARVLSDMGVRFALAGGMAVYARGGHVSDH